MKKIFQPAMLGQYHLKNRIIMAPMTRSRAPENVPNDLMVEYYRARASAGLIITEGTSPSPNGLGYARIPGLFNQRQVSEWKKVTEAVHSRGGRIFVQLMHTGRASHPLNMPTGSQIVAPTAIALNGSVWTDAQGLQTYPTPHEMTLTEIDHARKEYVQSAELAIEAGFDGVELHAANGYLMEQFLNPNSNQRTDRYGKTEEDRMRFVVETASETAGKIGGHRLGIRISPYGVFNDTGAFPGINSFYGQLTQKLSQMNLAYIHVVDHSSMGAPPVSSDLKSLIRENFKGAYILSGGYDLARAETDLIEKRGDFVAFGRPFIANPDLVEKLQSGQPLKVADHTTFYTPGPKGYTEI